MAEDINNVILVGRLTRDSELMYTNSGYPLCKFSIAVNRRRKQGEQWVDEANFFDVNLWGKRGESLSSYLTKGQQIAIEGQLKQERWEQDGQKRSKVTVEAEQIQLLGSKSDSSGGNSSQSSGQQNYQGQQYQDPAAMRGGYQQGYGNNHQGNRTQQGQGFNPPPSYPENGSPSQPFQSYQGGPAGGYPPQQNDPQQRFEDDIPF